jgi:hypothetical protein
MEVIKPTKEQVFESLRADGCCWLGGNKCHCYSRQLRICMADAERRLTITKYTEAEIMERRAENAKFIEELNKILEEYF